MSVGTLITVKRGIITKRAPIWPFPSLNEFPRRNADGSETYFERIPYYNFIIGDKYENQKRN